MNKIYKDASNQYTACSVFYVNDGKVYNDSECTDQTCTSALKQAFKQGEVFINVDETLYKAEEYSESEGIGTVKYVEVGKASGKNKYPVMPKDDIDYVSVGGLTSMKYIQGDGILCTITPNPTEYNVDVDITFDSDSYMYKTSNSFGNSTRTISVYISKPSWSSFGSPNADFRLESGSIISDIVTMDSEDEICVSITTTTPDLKIVVYQIAGGGSAGPLSITINKIQIEIGSIATEYEPYTETDRTMIFSAVSKAD